MSSAIGDYAIIGDGGTCALVAPTGSIDFLCWPKFDSDACFVALLGDERHGFWRIAPAGFVASTTRRYRGDSSLLERVIGSANDVGLLSEEYDVPSRSLVGNILQALTHLAL